MTRGWARQHGCGCLPGLDCPGIPWPWPAHCVSYTQSSPQHCPCSESPPASLDIATVLLRGLWSGFDSKPHMTTSLKNQHQNTPKIIDPLLLCSHHRQYPQKPYKCCTLEALCNPRQGFSYTRKMWKDSRVQIITEIVKNTTTCILSVWPQLFHCWEMHPSKVKISHKPVFLPKAFVLSVLSSLIYLWREQDLAQYMPATKWKAVTALSKPLSRLSARMTIVRADADTWKRADPQEVQNYVLGSSLY